MKPIKYGYARVSSKGQSLEAQIQQLKSHGVLEEHLFKEKVSGRKKEERIRFLDLLRTVQKGDTIVVTKLDRFARSTRDALSTIEMLNEKEISLVILNLGGQKVDTTSSYGKFMMTVLSGISELEADMIRERQAEGIALAKERGIYKGRPKKYTSNNPGLKHAMELMKNRDRNKLTVKDIENITKISRATLYRESRRQEI